MTTRRRRLVKVPESSEIEKLLEDLSQQRFDITRYQLTDDQQVVLMQFLQGRTFKAIARETRIAETRIRMWLVSDVGFQDAIRDCASAVAVTGRAMLDRSAIGALEFLTAVYQNESASMPQRIQAAVEILKRATYLSPRDVDARDVSGEELP